MNMKELEVARENASSFPGLTPPISSKEIGRIEGKCGTYIYYKDEEGSYWYSTERGIAYELHMEELRKKHAKKIR